MNHIALLPRLCRTCGKSSRETRFDPMSKHLCTACKDGARTARADRIEARGPRVAEAVREDDSRSNERHLAWIRRCPCAVRNADCEGPVVPHHVRRETDGGAGMKPSDRWAVPLCAFGHHNGGPKSGHVIGWETFELENKIDLRPLAIKLAAASPHLKSST